MKQLLNRRVDMVVLGVMALVAGLIVAVSGQRDTMLFVMAMPVFLIAALMGFRRSLAPEPVKVEKESEPVI